MVNGIIALFLINLYQIQYLQIKILSESMIIKSAADAFFGFDQIKQCTAIVTFSKPGAVLQQFIARLGQLQGIYI
ncbi:MAG: hypothetical protein PV347_03205, partial [Rickettsiaceae bacterium]|nr:hypothetical protein [Rickettsiaceae bacterium]